MEHITLLIFTALQFIVVSHCQENPDCQTPSRDAESCTSHTGDSIIHLEPLDDSWIDKDKIVFIESSGRDHLPVRYACAAESATKSAKMSVLVLLTSPVLNLSANNITELLYRTNHHIHFYHLDPEKILQDSPFGQSADLVLRKIEKSPYKIIHLSDALRLAVIYKYGGWYADFDTMFLRNFAELQDIFPNAKNMNFISTDNFYEQGITKKLDAKGHQILGLYVANGLFRFAKSKSEFLLRTIRNFIIHYKPNVRSSGGSRIMTRVLRYMCNLERTSDWIKLTVEKFSAEACQGLQLVHPKYFYPLSWVESTLMFHPGMSKEDWKKRTEHSFTMDFFLTSSKANAKVLKPKYYGNSLPAYAALGPDHCPHSFFSEQYF